MAVRIILLIVVAIAMVGIFGNLTSQGGMSNAIQGFHVSVATIAYSSEFNEIRLITDDFMQLRAMGSSDEAKEFAEKLDKRINNLRLVKTYCDQAISTFELSLNTNPYEKLQKLCPALEDVSFSKALQLFSLI